MLVSGYKHHTWQCSSCSAVERRMTFTRGKTPTPMMEPTQTMAAEPTQTAPVRTAEPVEPAQRVTVETRQTVSVEPAPTASVKTTVSVEATQKEAVETTQQVPVQPTIQNRQSLSLQRIARAKERARSLKERVTVPREAADEAKRRAQFKVFWDNLLSVPSSSISSEELSSVKAEVNNTRRAIGRRNLRSTCGLRRPREGTCPHRQLRQAGRPIVRARRTRAVPSGA